MKKVTGGLVAVLLVLTCFLVQSWAEEVMPQTAQAADPWAQAQALIDKGGVENCKQGLDMCLEAVKKDPGGFQSNWMAAQACREYGLAVKKSETNGWEKVCKEYGKKGMGFAEKAIAIDPSKPQGHYWYGTSVGIYSDGVSILTALKEGLKDKTQNSFETAYKIDKAYDKHGSVGALGRFWQVLPWPLNDTDKSIEYYREYQKTSSYNDPDTVEIRIYLAEILMESGKTKDEAKSLLSEAVKITDASGDRYWNKRAKELLADL
ncbi:MAG: tetratricopeptide repeat protein [Desulfosalsimonadaceae bacterium]